MDNITQTGKSVCPSFWEKRLMLEMKEKTIHIPSQQKYKWKSRRNKTNSFRSKSKYDEKTKSRRMMTVSYHYLFLFWKTIKVDVYFGCVLFLWYLIHVIFTFYISSLQLPSRIFGYFLSLNFHVFQFKEWFPWGVVYIFVYLNTSNSNTTKTTKLFCPLCIAPVAGHFFPIFFGCRMLLVRIWVGLASLFS